MKHSIQKTLCLIALALVIPCAAKDIALYVHGTKLPGIDMKRRVFGGYIPLGLHSARSFTQANHPHDIINALCTGDHIFAPKSSLYFFGWDGLFPPHREQAARELYDALLALMGDDEEPLHIKCLTHSHGGNVILYLIKLIDTNNAPIIFDELVFMGCPIQQITEKFAYSQTIVKLYNLYSNGDDVQQSDPQGLYPEARVNGAQPPLMSRRTLSRDRENMWEIAMRIDGKKIGHQAFIDPIFLLSVRSIIDQANAFDPCKLHVNLVVKSEHPIEHINLRIIP